jgi:peptide/nickel transport system substrate-binding protein
MCFWLGLIAGLAGCSRLPEPALPTLAPTKDVMLAAPTPTPPPIHTDLIVCLAQEPSSLYLYGDTSREADTILEAIYDGPIDVLGFQPKPVILDGLPTFANGGARFESVSLRSGDIYVNPETDQPESLARGMPYLPSGCTQTDCIQTYSGGAVDMDRLVADFGLKADLTWADGEPLTSADSVYSYSLDGDPATPTTKYLFARTFSYKALDDRTVEWIGLPGFVDADYQSNFWTPLPEHVLNGMSPDEVWTSDLAARMPIGWGPYQIDHWTAGEQIVLAPNTSYWADAPEKKGFRRVIFRFLGDQAGSAIDQVKTGECDLLDETLLGPGDVPQLDAAQKAADLKYASVPGPLVMRMDMNLDPVGKGQATGLFSDVRTRRALSACIDRQEIIDSVLHGTGEPADSYLPPSHPLYSAPGTPEVYDPAAGRQLLDDVGWTAGASEAETRTASGIPGVEDGTNLSFEMLMPTGDVYARLGTTLTAELSQCGVEVTVKMMQPADLFASWPDGIVFGRTFQIVVWSWPTLISPPCDMFASWEVPSDDHPYGSNASGFSDEGYDAACRQSLLGVPDSAAYAEAVDQTQQILRNQVPDVPLFVRPRLVAYAPWLCGISLDPSSPSVLWNVEALHACSAGT